MTTEPTDLKQPKSLYFLAATELWERFGYYIVQSLLVLYLTLGSHWSDDKAYMLVGMYSTLVYITPIVGGWLADTILGYRFSVLLGGVLLGLGYFTLALFDSSHLLYGLTLIVVGNGFLKPNISSFLGDFYSVGDVRREAGFTLFYLGINTGSFLATVGAGYIQRYFGWSTTFAAAALGMVFALVTFLYGFKYYGRHGLVKILKSNILLKEKLLKFGCLVVITLLLLGCCYGLFYYTGIGNEILLGVGIAVLLLLLYLVYLQPKDQRKSLLILIILILFSIVFWGLSLQFFFSMNLFVDRNVDRMVFGHLIPPTAFIGLEPVFIILFSVPLAKMWQHLAVKGKNPSASLKFVISMIFMALMFLLLVVAIYSSGLNHKTHPLFLVFVFFLGMLGEMFISPIALALVTQLAPSNLVGLMMGVWFMATGFGGGLAGILARDAAIPETAQTLVASNTIYAHAFMHYAVLSVAIALIILLLQPFLKHSQ